MIFNKESDFEKALITLLFDKGWSPEVIKYPTEADLIENWKQILFENNRDIDRLNDAPLTDGEMQQILEQIKSLRTPVRLNGFINGKTVTIKRDNPDDPWHVGHEVSLKIYDRQEIAAGQSRYQIAEQPIFTAKDRMLPDRRGDFMLLINGMPVIHVELKKTGIPVTQAVEQIKKYAHEGVFTGLFSLVQIFVAMNPDETLYFANPGPDGKFNDDYYFHWADFYNRPINDWQQIAEHLLSIPMAHEMIGFYNVADSTDDVLKVMRSYQYYAAKAISVRVAGRKWRDEDKLGGHVWHTTGSGKTLTSFKSAHLIAESGDADKVVFLIDRVELGTQSLGEYRGFADDATTVQETENTGVLITKLKSSDPADTLIVTSIQKMSRIQEEGGYKAKDIELINRKRIVFIVDECHRDVFGEMMRKIKETFPLAMFFGFTGTPIQPENQKKMNTTTDVFGDELHRYSIADGIRDGNVLGFDPTMVMTYKDQDLRRSVALEKAKAKDESEVAADPKKQAIFFKYMNPSQVPMAGHMQDDGKWFAGIEDYIPKSQYNCEKHHKAVVTDILANWSVLSRFGKFHAILATSSIPEAIDYYDLFRSLAPTLRVAALFDQNIDNDDGAIVKEDAIKKMLKDYNGLYDQDYTIPTYHLYKKDVSYRLAHKKPYEGIENHPEKQLNLLIVVDQMLTGFDSKWVNTLYLDKVLLNERLIQAVSRTNRLANRHEKPHGIIRYYRYPHSMARNVESAFALYSGARPYGLFVDKLDKNLTKMNEIFRDIADLFTAAGIDDFIRLPDEQAEKAKFAKLFKEFNAYLEAAYIQGFAWGKPNSANIELALDENTYLVLAKRYKELFSGEGGGGGGDDDVPYDIDSYLTEINTEKIDTDYMNSRFVKYVKALTNGTDTEPLLNELHKSFAVLSRDEQRFANMFLLDVQRGKVTVDEGKTLMEYISEYRAAARNDSIHRFATDIGVDEAMLRSFMDRHVTNENINEFGLFDSLMNSVDMAVAKAYFENQEGHEIKPFRIRAKVDNALRKFILAENYSNGEN